MICPEFLCGVIGHPLTHSLSPVLHTWAFAHAGRPGAYMSWPVPPGHVEEFVRAARLLHIHGVSVTIPHKETVLPLLDYVSLRARIVGAVNTLYRDEAHGLCGENTDIHGFLAPLRRRASARRALVLGAGGAARAVLAGLKEWGAAAIGIANRNGARAQTLAEDFAVEAVAWEQRGAWGADMLINATPLGMRGEGAGATPFPAEAFTGSGLAYDLVYNPLETRFLREAKAAGWEVQDGLDMFVEQGIEQFRLWTEHSLPEDLRPEIRALLLSELSRRDAGSGLGIERL